VVQLIMQNIAVCSVDVKERPWPIASQTRHFIVAGAVPFSTHTSAGIRTLIQLHDRRRVLG